MADSLKMCQNLSVVLRMPNRDAAPLTQVSIEASVNFTKSKKK